MIASSFHARVRPFTFWFTIILVFSFILLGSGGFFMAVGVGMVVETWSAVDGAVGASGWAGGQVHWVGLYLDVIGVWVSE